MSKSSTAVVISIGLAAGCAPIAYIDSDAQKRQEGFDFSGYCWSGSHFMSVDLERSEFVQIVNDDMVLYTISGEPGYIYCAYPVDGEKVSLRAREMGLKLSRRRSVIP